MPAPPFRVSLPNVPTGNHSVLAVEDVIPGPPNSASSPLKPLIVVAHVPGREVVSATGFDPVVTGLTDKLIVAVAAEEHIVAAGNVLASSLPQLVGRLVSPKIPSLP